MELKAGYKQTDAGMIPEDWYVQALDDGVKLLSGHHVLAYRCNTDGRGVPYITGPADFPNGVIRHTKFTERPTTICREHDILVTVKGSGAGTMIISDGEYCISRQLMAVRVADWDTRYVYSSLLLSSSLIGSAATGLIPGLSRRDLLHKKLAIPPVAEQRAIAAALSDVDALIGALDSTLAKKRDLKQAAMEQLLTGQRRLPGFCDDWERLSLGDLFSFKNGLNKGKEFFGSGTPIVNYMDVYRAPGLAARCLEGRVTVSKQEQRAFDVRKGDVFFTRTSENGKRDRYSRRDAGRSRGHCV